MVIGIMKLNLVCCARFAYGRGDGGGHGHPQSGSQSGADANNPAPITPAQRNAGHKNAGPHPVEILARRTWPVPTPSTPSQPGTTPDKTGRTPVDSTTK